MIYWKASYFLLALFYFEIYKYWIIFSKTTGVKGITNIKAHWALKFYCPVNYCSEVALNYYLKEIQLLTTMENFDEMVVDVITDLRRKHKHADWKHSYRNR